MLKVPSISTQVGSHVYDYATDSLPHRSHIVIQVAPLLYQSLHQVVDVMNSWAVVMENFYQHAIFPADYTILFLFMQKLCKRWRQYWQGINKQ